jgi:hypothetical protein
MTSPSSRPLTPGEAAMARQLFGAALDPEPVRIHARGFFWFGLQHPHTAVTPNGQLYFPPAHARPDFSQAPPGARHWFMHELVHVWQYQLGYPVMLRGALRLFLGYRYLLAPQRRLGDYNMEAQGDLLADYYVLRHLGAAQAMRQPENAHALPLFEQVLGDFLRDPAARTNLPRWRSAG